MSSDGMVSGAPDMQGLFEHYRRHQFAPNGKQIRRQLMVHGIIAGSPDIDSSLKEGAAQAYQLVCNMHTHLCSLGWMNREPVLDGLPGLDKTVLRGMSSEEANQLLVRLGCFQKLTSVTVDANLRPDPSEPLPDNTPRDVWSGIRNVQPTQSLPDYISRARYLLEAISAAHGQ